MQLSDRAKGYALGLTGVMLLTPDTLLLKAINAEPALIIAARSLLWGSLAGLLCAALPSLRRGFRWKPGVLYAVLFAGGLMCYPLSVKYTYGTNALVMLAVTPLLGAIGAHFFLREAVHPLTWAAAVIVAAGAGLIFSDAFTGTHFAGNAWGLATALVLAASSVLIRRYGNIPVMMSLTLGGMISAVPWMLAADWHWVGARDAMLIGANGLMIVPYAMIMFAAKRLQPPVIGLIFLLETVFGSLWLWLVISETPPLTTLLAGTLIVTVLAVHGVASMRWVRAG